MSCDTNITGTLGWVKLTPHQRIIGGKEIYKTYGFGCRIAPEQIEEATETIIKAIFNNFYNQIGGKN